MIVWKGFSERDDSVLDECAEDQVNSPAVEGELDPLVGSATDEKIGQDDEKITHWHGAAGVHIPFCSLLSIFEASSGDRNHRSSYAAWSQDKRFCVMCQWKSQIRMDETGSLYLVKSRRELIRGELFEI